MMSTPLKMVALLLALLWLPATMHCQLEAAGVLPPFGCCEAEQSPDPSEEPCCAACANVESGKVLADLKPIVVKPADVPSTEGFPAAGKTHPHEIPSSYPHHPPGRPELSVHWQFDTRAALPARAPCGR